jgi:hypothetical protein
MQLLDELQRWIFAETTPPLAEQLNQWMATSARFRSFVDVYRDKIRKKVRTAQPHDGLADLYAELAIAYLLLRDRRCVVEYEKLRVGQQRAPDFTVTFKTHTLCHVEVTRLRALHQSADGGTDPQAKLINTLCDKLGQLPPSAITLVACVTNPGVYTTDDVRKAVAGLQALAAQKDDQFFTRRRLDNARHFQRQQQRLSAILLCPLDHQNQFLPLNLWLNPQARHRLPSELKNLLLALV